jgi:hypothetical protein
LAASVVTLALFAFTPASAEDVPEGIPVGPWILAPSFQSRYEASNNIFYENDQNAERDRIAKIGAGIVALLPFRNSSFELSYQARKENYDENPFPRDLSQVAGFDLELKFKSGDVLAFRDVYRRDFARAEEVDTGGELTSFEGEPYNINRWEIELSRTDPGRQGYVVRIRRQDFNYEGDKDIGFFEYRGFDNAFEYRQPLPENRSWVVRYGSRRFDHYDPFYVDAPHGVPFRKEKADDVQLGVLGTLGEGQPFFVNLGYGRFRYEGLDESEFDGLVGEAAWRLQVGGRTRLDLKAIRRALPSNSQTHYINNAVRADLEREWLRFESGTELEFIKNDYADEVPDFGVCDGRRKDSTYKAEVYWGWRVHERLRFRMSSYYSRRSSTCDSSDYEAAGIETGIALGWF